MSDKYSIDDILAEIDKKRGSSGHSEQHSESVTEIIGGSELDQLMRSSGARTRMSDSEIEDNDRAEEEAARERAENIRRAAEANEKRRAEQARKKSGDEEKRRAAREEKERREAERAERAEQKRLEAEQKKQSELEEKRLEQERAEQRRLEAQRAEEERTMQFSVKNEEPQEPEHSGFTAELSSPVEAAKLFAEPDEDVKEYVQPQSEHVQPFVKPAVSGADDDIVFHTRSDLVQTETQKLRKLQRIEEINKALLAADRAAEEPDDLVDSLNPMESREKAVDELKSSAAPQEIGDTLAVSGNDLKKMSGGEAERVKEYSPVTSRKKPHPNADDILFTPGAQKKQDVSEKERRSSDALIASLNEKLKEQREKNLAEERTVTLTDFSDKTLPPRALNIDYDNKVIDTSILPKTDPVAAVREAEALAARKKRRISSFMLEDIDDEQEEQDEEDDDEDEEEDEVIDLDDENVITERLERAGKGLTGRLVILGLLTAAAIIATAFFSFKITGVPILSQLSTNFEVFLYTELTIGILSFAACSSVITNGFSRLIKKKPDGDTLCGFAHIGALASIIVYLAEPNYLMMKQSFVYLMVSMLSLCFNTVSKLCTVRAAKNNFRFISGDMEKYFAECTDGEDAEQLSRGAVRGFPVVASMRKTEMLCDFIISTYCEDISDRISRVMTPIILGLSVVGGAIGFFSTSSGNSGSIMNQWSFAATVFSAVLCIGATFTGALVVMLPMLSASRKNGQRRAAILGYSAVEDFSAVNSVLVEAKTLFPAGSVSIRNIWDYNKNGTNGAQHVTIDEAIIYAASLAVSSDSILADPLFNMLNYKPALLKKVSNCVYESGLGVSGWVGSRRILLGSRDHMKSHGIVVPDAKKESALNKNHDEVVYLAVAGEVCMLFFVTLSANPQVREQVNRLSRNGVSLVIKTVDGILSEGVVSELFDIYADDVRILPAENHDLFDEHTKYAGKGSAAVSCDGTFSSLASAINCAKALRERIRMGCIMEIAGVALGVLLAFIFAAFKNFTPFDGFWIAAYNAAWLVLTALVMSFKRI